MSSSLLSSLLYLDEHGENEEDYSLDELVEINVANSRRKELKDSVGIHQFLLFTLTTRRERWGRGRGVRDRIELPVYTLCMG